MDHNLRNAELPNKKQTFTNLYISNNNNRNQISRNRINQDEVEEFPPGIQSVQPGYSGQYFYNQGQYVESKPFLPHSFQEDRFDNSQINFGQEEDFQNPMGRSTKRAPEADQLLQQVFSTNQSGMNPKFQDSFMKAPGPLQKLEPTIAFENPGNFGGSRSLITENVFRPIPFSKEFQTKQSNSAEIPNRQDEGYHFLTTPIPDESKEKNSSANAVDELMKAIQLYQINCVSLLNEVGSKVKKKVDYLIKEVPTGKIKIFECICILDKDKIGFGKGNSKQGSKTDSATEGVKTLLSKEQFTYERAHITLSVQKTAGIGVYSHPKAASSTTPQQLDVQEINEKISVVIQDAESGLSKSQLKQQNSAEIDAALMNDSALYELNLIAKECFIEPHWIMSPPKGPNGEFETQVTFDKLEATGKGRKKLDAKRDAALKIIQQIRGSKELSERYNPKAKKQLSPSNSLSELTKNDQRKVLFESSLDSKIFGEVQNSSQHWKDNITKLEKTFEIYASHVKHKHEVDAETFDALHDFFKLVSDFSEMATRNPKQIMLDAPDHLVDYVNDCSLVPIGSFALDCMRKDKLIIDVLIVFQEIKKISNKDFLELYMTSLQECQRVASPDNQYTQFKLEFSVENSEMGNCLLVKSNFNAEKLVMQIHVSNLSQASSDENSSQINYDSAIVHISRIYDSLSAARLQSFRELMSLMRIWKTRCNLPLLSPELLDAILLTEFLTNPTGNLTSYIVNCLIIMSSEETLQASLKKCGAYYIGLYKEIPSKLKWQISSKASQSVEAIYQNKFDKSSFD